MMLTKKQLIDTIADLPGNAPVYAELFAKIIQVRAVRVCTDADFPGLLELHLKDSDYEGDEFVVIDTDDDGEY
jgi:hypothetical protein